MIDGRHASSILDVRTFRGPNIDSDHYLVAAKARARLCVANTTRSSMQGKLDIRKLQSQRTADAYLAQLSGKLGQPFTAADTTNDMGAHISHSMRSAAEEVLGFQRPLTRNPWYDQECREASTAKDAAYKKTLQSGATRSVVEAYRTKRRDEKRLFRRKKREQERRELEMMELRRSRNYARNFYNSQASDPRFQDRGECLQR